METLSILMLVGAGCNSHFCDGCCTAKGLKVREKLISVLGTFKGMVMLTLTVDPSLFEGPREALNYVRERRAIAELVRALERANVLHSRRYIAVLEFQENGMPHWHVLVESSFVPHALVAKLWGYNRPAGSGPVVDGRPAFGFVAFSAPKFASVFHAACYVAKYLVKTPKSGWPSWVMETEGQFKRFSVSQGFWKSGGVGAAVKAPAELTAEKCKRRTKGCTVGKIGDRVKRCCRLGAVVERTEDLLPDGEVRKHTRFVGTLGCTFGEAKRALGLESVVRRAEIPAEVFRMGSFIGRQWVPLGAVEGLDNGCFRPVSRSIHAERNLGVVPFLSDSVSVRLADGCGEVVRAAVDSRIAKCVTVSRQKTLFQR